jgi:hypothetical protein
VEVELLRLPARTTTGKLAWGLSQLQGPFGRDFKVGRTTWSMADLGTPEKNKSRAGKIAAKDHGVESS